MYLWLTQRPVSLEEDWGQSSHDLAVGGRRFFPSWRGIKITHDYIIWMGTSSGDEEEEEDGPQNMGHDNCISRWLFNGPQMPRWRDWWNSQSAGEILLLLLLLYNGPLIKEVMFCVQNSAAAAAPHTSLPPTGPTACVGSALTAAARRPPGSAASRTARRFKSTSSPVFIDDDDRVNRSHSAWDLAR